MSIKKIATALTLAIASFGALPAHAGFSLSAVGAADFADLTATGASYGTAFGFGALASMPVFPGFSGEVGALYMPRQVNTGSNSNISINYLEVPLLVRFTALPIISIGAGVYYASALGNATVTSGGTSTSVALGSSGYSSSDFGIVGSIQGSYSLMPMLSIIADARYLLGLTNQSSVSGQTVNFRDIEILAGLSLGF